ncbi:hypothetical protein BGLA2_300026 [Burkholderia gladioli]|nr:hypothetical protein BGLA2_300026 [Burkholderia gladioli]
MHKLTNPASGCCNDHDKQSLLIAFIIVTSRYTFRCSTADDRRHAAASRIIGRLPHADGRPVRRKNR